MGHIILVLMCLAVLAHAWVVHILGAGIFPWPGAYRLLTWAQGILILINGIAFWGWPIGISVAVVLHFFSSTILIPVVWTLLMLAGRNLWTTKVGLIDWRWHPLDKLATVLWSWAVPLLAVLTVARFLD